MTSDSVQGFSISYDEHPEARVLRVEGELALGTAERLREEGGLAVGDGALLIDLEGVTFLDSSGLRALLEIQRLAFARDCPMALLRPARPVTRVLELTHLRDEFDIVDEVAAAAGLQVRR